MNSTNLEELVPQLEGLDADQLKNIVSSLEILLQKTREHITAKAKSATPASTSRPPVAVVDDNLYRFYPRPDIDTKLLSEVHDFVKSLKYHPSSSRPHSPEIHLFGSHKYGFNRQSDDVLPTPIQPGSPLCVLVGVVSGIVGIDFNCILINHYRNCKCHLGRHKDDEKCLDRSSPIAAVSLGATRRLHIFLNEAKNKPAKTLTLTHGSLFTMEPGFQDLYYHSIPEGRKSFDNETGPRYSITLRRIIPSDTVPASDKGCTAEETPATVSLEEEEDIPSNEPHKSVTEAPDTVVFGSSLLKGLDEKLLSKYSKNFKVYCHRGARVSDIYEDVEKVQNMGELDTSKVSGVFLLCGGNDLENLKRDDDIKFVYEDIEDLVELTREAFPNAKIHIVSSIPRRSQYSSHIRNMHRLNYWLNSFCKKMSIRFVDIFSFFVVKLESSWILNTKLFNGSELHFSKTGDSVLAKVLIGVANMPR